MSDVTKNVQIAKNSLHVLSEVFELASNFPGVSSFHDISGKLVAAFPVAGAMLMLIEGFLPDGEHEEILCGFEKLSNKIDQVRDDIKELRNVITWETKELQYGVGLDRIELGIQYCFEIGKAVGKYKKTRYQERLKEVCSNQNYTLALNDFLDGITGNGAFRKSLLDEFYNTTRGDRQKISAFATRLLRLVCGGMMVVATYETMMRGMEGAEEVMNLYDSRLKEVDAKVQSVLSRCVENFAENMLGDLNTFLDSGRQDEYLANEMSNFMREKYDWLENYCIVYDELDEDDQQCIGGYRVESLHRNGKCGIVFYRTKGEPPRFYDRCHEIDFIEGEIENAYPAEGYKNIVAKLGEKGIGWSGCAVIRHVADRQLYDTFSTEKPYASGDYVEAILLLE